MSRRNRYAEERPPIVRRALDDRSRLAAALDDPAYVRGTVRRYARDMNGAVDGYEVLVEKWRSSLRVGEVFAVSPDMFHVVQAAAADLPRDYIMEHWHLFTEHGFLWLPQDITEGIEPMQGSEGWPPISLATWHHGTGTTRRQYEEMEPGVWVESLGDVRAVPGMEVNYWWKVPKRDYIVPVGSDFLPYGMTALGMVSHGYEGGREILRPEDRLSDATRFILALQLILRQELPTVARWNVPRSDVPGLRRLALSLDPVLVIDLRRRKYLDHPDTDDSASGRKQRVRSVVRGHWHSFWVGSGHALHPGGTEDKVLIQQWVMPYMRGPEDAPIKPRTDTVHVVRR
jgi:hypothetical protein